MEPCVLDDDAKRAILAVRDRYTAWVRNDVVDDCECLEALNDLHKRYPDDPVVLTLRAMEMITQARSATLRKKVRLLNQGLALMDKAMLMKEKVLSNYGSEGDVWMLMTRSIINVALPIGFRRDRQAYEDFLLLFEHASYKNMSVDDKKLAEENYNKLRKRMRL